MAKKVWDEEIDKTVDWGGDNSTENLPVAGRRVQEFIKNQLNSKMGVFYYDTANNRYIVFADADSRDKYLENPTLTELVLGTFDAPFNYTAEILLTTPNYVAILLGAKNNYIDFTFDVKNKQGQSTGEEVICTYTFIRGSVKKVVTQKYRPNTSVHFNVDDYLLEGTNTVIIGIVGQTTLAAITVSVTYQVVNLSLTDSMDISRVYNLLENPSAAVEIPYTISGTGTKIMEWYLDGELLEFIRVEDEIVDTVSSRTKYISLASLNQGKHSIQFRAYAMINGEKFYSQTLYRDVIVYTGANRNHIIAVAATIPIGYGILQPQDTMKLYGITQYIPYDIVFAVYSPTSEESIDTTIKVDNAVLTTIKASNGVVHTYSYISSTYGVKTLEISTASCTYNAELNISETDTTLHEIVENLQLDLQAIGKSNDSSDREAWDYGDFHTSFAGFNWNNTSGWVNGKLIISNGASISVNIAPFSPDPSINGKTLEFEFSTSNVSDDNAVICDLRNSNGVGLLLTASEATLTSSGGAKVSVKYKSEENIRVSFVINRKTGATMKGLAFIYINGVACGAVNFSTNDNFISDKTLTISGTSQAEVILRSLRFYDTALSSDQLLNNYILYRESVDELMSIYDKNNIYDEDGVSFSPDILEGQLPVMIITGNIPELENTNDKNKTIVVDVEYTNLQDPSRSFKMTSAQMRPQGTSSMSYPKKNFRLYTTKRDDTKLYDADGKLVPDRLYAFKEGAQPVDCWCMKADYAESSGTHNTGVARLWNDVMTNAQIDGEYRLRTEAQKKAIENDYQYDVRTTVDGFPILMFYRLTANDDLIFIGKYNFNNDKSTESVFGFEGIPGFDNTNMQCWEVLNNGHHLALFQDTTNFDTEWEEAFEARYPDVGSDADTSKLKAFCEWIVSTKSDLSKFKTEKWDHLDVYKMAAYYVYIMRFGAVDQTVKNAMFTSEDGEHFYYINYDNDTILGVRNDGLLIYPPTIDRQTLDETFETEVYAYAGHDSTLWNNLEADDEFMAIVTTVDNALYGAGLTYNNVIDMFDNQQSGKWCERVYNQDAQYKYIGPFTDSAINNLYMLQGPRKSHRRWWLSRRFNLLDSKFISGDYKASAFEIKMASAPSGISFKIVAGFDMNYGYGVNNIPIDTGVALTVGQEHTFTTKQVLNIGDPLRIYSAVNLQEIDVHEFIGYLSTITVTSVYNEVLGTKLRKLIIGVDTSTDSRRNTSISDISGLSQAKRLEYLDISGYKGITYLDLTQLYYLTTVKAKQSGLTSILFAPGCPLTTIELPSTLQVIDLNNLPNITESGITIEDNWTKVRGITIIKCSNLNTASSLIFNWYDNKEAADSECSLTLEGIYWMNVDVEDVIALGNIKNAGGTLSLKGRIRLTSCTQEQTQTLRDIYGDNCFDQSSELYISAPDAVYITGPFEINETESATYVGVAFSEHQGTITYSIRGDGEYGASIDPETGVLTTTETGVTRTIKVRATHQPTQGIAKFAEIDVVINKLIYPTSATINGNVVVNTDGQEYTLSLQPEGITGQYSVEWNLSGEAVDEGFISLKSQNNTKCVITLISNSPELKEATLTATITPNVGEPFNAIKQLQLLMEGIIMTKISNPEAMAICYAQGWCVSQDYMWEEEAAAVTDINTVFAGNVETFDEFQYFTGITSLPNSAFNCNLGSKKILKSIVLPDSVTTIGMQSIRGAELDVLDLKNINKASSPNGCVYSCRIKKLIIRNNAPYSSSFETSPQPYIYYGDIEECEIYHNNPTNILRECSVGKITFMANNITLGSYFYYASFGNNMNEVNFTNFERVKVIKRQAFLYNIKTNIILHSELETIEDGPFERCQFLSFTNQGNTKFIFNGQILIADENRALWADPNIEGEELTIPSSVTKLCDFFAYGTSGYDISILPTYKKITALGITEIGEYGCYGLSNLEELNAPNLKILKTYALDGCRNLIIDFSSQITYYGSYCLAGIAKDGKFHIHADAEFYSSLPNRITGITGITEITSDSENYITDSNNIALFGKVKSELSNVLSAYDYIIMMADEDITESLKLTIPDNITYLYMGSFIQGNKSIVEIDFNNVNNFQGGLTLSGASNLKKLTFRVVTPPKDIRNDSFGSSNNNYTGRNTYNTGENELIVPENATGYDKGYWLDPLCNPEKCGFTLKKTLPAVETLETLSMENKQLRSFAAMAINMMSLPDEASLNYTDIYPKWEDLCEKEQKATVGFKFRYGETLYKVITEHSFGKEWVPSETPSLYTPIADKGQGTIDNPIKWVIGMELIKGKYYLDEGIKYLCVRDSGQGMSFSLKDLVSGGFVEQVK